MGTYYTLTIVGRQSGTATDQLHQAVKAALGRVEALMSAYREDSDVSRINAAEHRDWTAVAPETANLIEQAIHIGQISGGAYDITAGRLVKLWGFGPGQPAQTMPDQVAIDDARQHVGLDKLAVRADPPAVRKNDPQVRIDLSSIAKGFGVDAAAQTLERRGVKNYCMEVGGEIRVHGRNPRGTSWQIAIESPQTDGRSIHRVIAANDGALATSGDYRIFIEQAGTRYSHIIDARTGRPAGGNLTSVTVMAPSCALADGWATALMATGPDDGFALAVREHIAALFLVKTAGGIEERATPGFKID